MQRQRVEYNVLETMVRDIFLSYGYSLGDSATIADIIIDAEICGKLTHGLRRLNLYHQKIRNNKIDRYAKSMILNETNCSISFDACNRIGQLAAYEAMQAAISKSKVNGIGIANVVNSNNFGTASYYAKMASKVDCIGISMSNSPAFCFPINGRKPVLGTNPIAVSIPDLSNTFCMDISTAMTSIGNIELYKMENKSLPKGWVVDEYGDDIIDPTVALEKIYEKKGGILPLGGRNKLYGGHKGYALSLVIELLTSALINQRINAMKNGIGHFFCVIDCSIFGDIQTIKENVTALLKKCILLVYREGRKKVVVPGEHAFITECNSKKDGIFISDMVINDIANIMKDCNLDIEDYIKIS